VRLIRFPGDDGKPLAGVLDADITTLAAVPGLGGLLAQPLSRIREICAAPGGEIIPAGHAELLAPWWKGLTERQPDLFAHWKWSTEFKFSL
jgi:hypothetical protein